MSDIQIPTPTPTGWDGTGYPGGANALNLAPGDGFSLTFAESSNMQLAQQAVAWWNSFQYTQELQGAIIVAMVFAGIGLLLSLLRRMQNRSGS